jgi:propanol-preferring alcohol dehydrogenase
VPGPHHAGGFDPRGHEQGSRIEEVIAMARADRIHAETAEFPLGQAGEVYRKLKAGEISGRAVLIPEGAAA